jgi:hypothetical protein
VLEAAVSRAQKTREDFPTPIELRLDADAVAHRVQSAEDDERHAEPLPEPVVLGMLPDGTAVKATRFWRYYDERCSDSGWASWWCGDRSLAKEWQLSQTCGRRGEHGAHEWVGRCACAESNPSLIRKRENQTKYAAPAKRSA